VRYLVYAVLPEVAVTAGEETRGDHEKEGEDRNNDRNEIHGNA